MIITDSTPLSSSATVGFPLEKVKEAVTFLLNNYSQYFIAKKNGINNDLGTYIFDRPKGIDTPTIRITLSSISDNQTKVDINCSSQSMTTSSADYQLAITEVQNILAAKLNGKSDQEILEVLKMNNSGNGVWGCIKGIGCLVVIVVMIIYLISGFINILK